MIDLEHKRNHNGSILVSKEQVTIPAITLKNIPEQLYGNLKLAARAHHRSINSEILFCLEQMIGAHRIDVLEQLALAKNLRAKTVLHIASDNEFNAAKTQGRT